MPKSQGYRIGGKFYSRGLQTDRSTRPNDPSMLSVPTPPNFGRSIIPHAITFSGMTNTLSRAYRKADEALRDNVHNAHMMLNDPMVTEPLFAIQQMVSLFNWHIEAGDMKDPEQVALAAEVTKIIEKTPRFMMYRWVSLLGIWFGSYGIEHQYAWQKRGGRKAYYIKSWTPISGDKLHFRYDDGRYHYDPEQVGVRVSNAIHTKDLIAGDRTFEPTADGLAYFLQPWERDCWLIHKNFVMDGNFEDPLSAEKVHGVGLRSFVYWIWLLKQEALAQLTEVVERTARGFTIYWYPSGNAQARAEVEKIAQEQSHQNAILMPKDPELEQYGIDVVPADTGGITALQDLIRNHYGHLIKRVILGQTLSSESDATGLGSGVADLHMDTLYNVAAFHAANLEETITRDLVWPTRDRNYPQYRDVDLHFRIDTDTAKPAEELESAYKLWTMGARIKEQELMDKVGLSTPDATDRTLQNPSILQQMRLAEQAMQKDQFHPGDDVQPDLAGSMSQWLGGGIGPTAEGDDQGPMQMSEQGHPQKYFGPIRHSKSPWLDRVTAQKHAKEDWSPYTGPNGGTGWQNNKTGEIVYGDEEPWSDRKPAKDDDQQPPQGGSDDGGDQPSGGDPQPQQGPPSGANAPQVAAEFGYAGGNPYSFATTTARRMGYEADGQTQEERAAAAAKFLDSIHGDLRAVTDTAKTLGFKPSAKIATTNAIHAARYIVAQAETKGFKASTNDVGQNVRDAANFLHGNMANERPDPEPPPVQLTQGSSGSTALADSLGAILVGLVASAIGGQMGGIVSRLAHEWLKSQQPQTPAAPKPDRKGKTKDPTKPTNEAAKQALLELSGKVGFVPRLSPPPPAPKQPKTDKPAKEPRQPKEPKQKPASAPKASQPTPDDYGVKVRPTTAEEAAAAPKRHDAYAGLERLGKEKAGQDIASAGYKSLRDFTTAMQQKGLDAERVRKMYPKTSAAVEETYGGSLEDALGRSEPQEKRESPQAAINARLDEMVEAGELPEADKDAFRSTLAQAWDDMRVAATERETAKAEARRRLELTQADINRLENQGFDSGSQHKKIKGLDTLGREFASMYPGLGWGRGYVQGENHDDSVDYGEKLWSLIGEGKKDLPTQHSDEVFERARGMFGLMEAAHAADAYGMEMPVFGDEEGEPEADQGDDDFDFGGNKRPDDWDAMTEDERAEADPEYVPFRKWQDGLQERIAAADDMRQRYRKANERGDTMTASIYRAACNQADAEVERYALTGNRKRRYHDSPGQQLLGGFDNHGHQGSPQFEESKHPRSPKGGMTVGGEFFPGGKFIPARAMANASKSELKQLGMDFSSAESEEVDEAAAQQATGSGGQQIDPAEDYAKNGTRAKAFKDWFGDSKVVDESGKPLVVYHGTKADFGAFDASGGPIFFGTKEKAGDFTGDGGAILPAYLSIQNPIDLPWVGTLGLYASDIRRYKQEGHDGARMKDGVWVAFDPSQIKSINNRGTFDPSDDRIAYAKPGDPDKYAGRKFDPSQRSLFDDTPPQGPQARLPGMGGEWMHDPTPQASNRWTNTQTGEHRYQDSKPGSGAAIGTKQRGLFDAPQDARTPQEAREAAAKRQGLLPEPEAAPQPQSDAPKEKQPRRELSVQEEGIVWQAAVAEQVAQSPEEANAFMLNMAIGEMEHQKRLVKRKLERGDIDEQNGQEMIDSLSRESDWYSSLLRKLPDDEKWPNETEKARQIDEAAQMIVHGNYDSTRKGTTFEQAIAKITGQEVSPKPTNDDTSPAHLTDAQWKSHVDGLMQKAADYDASRGLGQHTVTDVTPPGYGPSGDMRARILNASDPLAEAAKAKEEIEDETMGDRLAAGLVKRAKREYEQGKLDKAVYDDIVTKHGAKAKAAEDAERRIQAVRDALDEHIGNEHAKMMAEQQAKANAAEADRANGTTGDKPEPEAIQSDDPIDFAHQLTGGKVAKETIEKIAPDDLRRILDRESAPKHVIDTDAPPGGWTAKDKVPSSYAQDRVARKLDAYAKQAWTMTEGQYKDKADHFDSTVYNAAVADAIRDGKEVPDAVLDQGDGKFRQFKQKTERFNAMPEAQRQLYDAKTTQITEDDYLEQQRLRRLEQEKTNLANYDEQLKRLKPKAKTPASKRKYEQEKANLESWKRMAQKSIDRLESIKHGSEDINAESWRKSYRDTVKKAISKGEQVPPEVANQHPEFRKAVDARQRYEKGWNTSFKNKSLAVDESRKADRGYKAKRQDGKDMTDDHQQYIETVVDEVEQALGVSLKEAFAATDVTFAHTNGKHPFLSDAGGMYHPTERTVTMGIRFLWMDIKSGAHEIGHWLDYEGGKAMGKSRRVKVSGTRSANVAYASEDEHWNNGVTSLASQLMNNSYDARKLAKAKLKDARTDEEKAEIQKNKTHLGAYWHTPREIWARLFEQYVSEELAGESKLAAEDLKYYRSGPAYWSESAWKQLRPLVKSAIERKLNAIKSTTR